VHWKAVQGLNAEDEDDSDDDIDDDLDEDEIEEGTATDSDGEDYE